MVFVCPPEKESRKRIKKLGELKDLIKAVEEKMAVPCIPICFPCCPELPGPSPPQPQEPAFFSERHNNNMSSQIPHAHICCNPCCLAPQQPLVEPPCPPPQPPDVMVCYRVTNKKLTKNGKRPSNKNLKKSKSRELRASILYVGCDCEKRNGLQDDCHRSECYGSPDCLTKPNPICGPSEFAGGKHLARRKNEFNATNNGGGEEKMEEDGTMTVKYRCYPAMIAMPKCLNF